MLITFKSKAAADIPMFAENAQQLLALIGKSLQPSEAPRGIIAAAEVPAALATLKAAAERARSEARAREQHDADRPEAPISVSLAQRAYPLIDMLERAATQQADVVWGV